MNPADLLSIGMGAAYLAKDKLEGFINELEERGEINKEEASKLFNQAKERAEKEKNELDERVRAKVKEVVSELGLATKADIEELKLLLKNK